MCGILPNMPGLAKSCNSALNVGAGATDLYSLSWCVSFVVSGVVYWGLGRVWPMAVEEGGAKVVEVIEGREGSGEVVDEGLSKGQEKEKMKEIKV